MILAWDKAGIDFAFWHKVKQSSGLYFISREKENMKLIRCGERPVDHGDHRNAGVRSDENVGPGSGAGAMLRRITYLDPAENTLYVYLTSEMTLPPGLLVLIYKQRWDVEKVFDELKTKLVEKKAWGSKAMAKATQSQFLCLAHNLMVLLEQSLLTTENIDNTKERKRRAERRETAAKKRSDLRGHADPTLHGKGFEVHPLAEELRLPPNLLGSGSCPATACLREFLGRSFPHRCVY